MAAATGAVLMAGTAAYQIYNSEQQRKEAQRELNDYERQSLDNAFEALPLSTVGSDKLLEQSGVTSANMVDALRSAGGRALVGGIPKVVAATNEINQDAREYLDNQDIRRNYAIAGDNARIEGITENRDNNNINALSSQVIAGKQGVWDGAMGLASAAGYGMRSYTPSNNPAAPPAMVPADTGVAPTGPTQYPSPYFDFGNSYNPAPPGGPNQYNPFYFNFPTSYSG